MTKERKNCRASIEKMIASGQSIDMIIDSTASKYMRIQARKMRGEQAKKDVMVQTSAPLLGLDTVQM
jgi:hypothetical protein